MFHGLIAVVHNLFFGRDTMAMRATDTGLRQVYDSQKREIREG